MKMPTIIFILLLAEKISCSVEHEKRFITSGPDQTQRGCSRDTYCFGKARLAPVVFVLYLFLSFSTLFFIMILFNPTSSYLWLSSQGTEVNKNSTSYTSVVSSQKKRRKRKKRKIKKGSRARLWKGDSIFFLLCCGGGARRRLRLDEGFSEGYRSYVFADLPFTDVPKYSMTEQIKNSI